MDHDHALRIAAVEKYLLNELPQDERDQFEEHFFDCQECTLDLRAGAVFLSQAKKEFAGRRELPGPARKKRRQSFLAMLLRPAFAVPAFAALVFAVGYQNAVTFPRLKREAASQNIPQVLPTLSLVAADSRGGETASVQAAGKPFLLQFDVPAGDTRFVKYTCLLYSPAGTLLWETTISPEQAKDTISLQVPPVQASAGTYRLLIRGDSSGNAVDLARYRFRSQ
ncbi:MAG TPA: zf-HC2 domain-containing protein [Acidobacteriaceae bacterium]